ncbi:MAG: lipocalin family protein [Deltaproteobacteria bacterium]|nr:lipocalin family protein [Deltaproteobacteria bacterium]
MVYIGENSDQGCVKVYFVGPFYGSCILFELGHGNHQYVLVCGHDKSYLWVLAGETRMKEGVKKILTAKAAASGFDTWKLIAVDQN